MSRIRSLGDRVLARLALIGADPQDDDDTRASKSLLVLISVLILPVSLLWAALYLAFGSPVGWVPLVYFAVLLAVDRRLLAHTELRPVPACRPGRHPVRSDAVDDPARGLPRRRRGRTVGNPRPARGARVQRRASRGSLVRRVRRRVPRLGARGRAAGRRVAGRPRVVHEHDARPQRGGGRHDRVHAAGRVRRPAPERARGAARGAGEGGEPAAQHPAAVDRRQAQGRDADDRGPVHLGVDPVRRRRGLHPALGAPPADRGRRRAQPAVQPLRHARRAPWAREDQDDRRLLHGRGRRPLTPARPCARARPDGAGHAGGHALGRRVSGSSG